MSCCLSAERSVKHDETRHFEHTSVDPIRVNDSSNLEVFWVARLPKSLNAFQGWQNMIRPICDIGPAIHQGFWNLTEPEPMKWLKGSQVEIMEQSRLQTDVPHDQHTVATCYS